MDHPLSPARSVSVKDTDVHWTKKVDDSEGGGRLMCSKHKFKGVSL